MLHPAMMIAIMVHYTSSKLMIDRAAAGLQQHFGLCKPTHVHRNSDAQSIIMVHGPHMSIDVSLGGAQGKAGVTKGAVHVHFSGHLTLTGEMKATRKLIKAEIENTEKAKSGRGRERERKHQG